MKEKTIKDRRFTSSERSLVLLLFFAAFLLCATVALSIGDMGDLVSLEMGVSLKPDGAPTREVDTIINIMILSLVAVFCVVGCIVSETFRGIFKRLLPAMVVLGVFFVGLGYLGRYVAAFNLHELQEKAMQLQEEGSEEKEVDTELRANESQAIDEKAGSAVSRVKEIEPERNFDWLLYLGIGASAALIAGAAALGIAGLRRRAPPPVPVFDGKALVRQAAEKAGKQLAYAQSLGLRKDAVVAAYGSFVEAVSARAGVERERTETAREFERLVRLRGIELEPASRLTALFERARYTTGEIPESDVAAARECFEEIAAYCARRGA